MIRSIAVMMVAALQGLAAASGFESASAQERLTCESQAPGEDKRDIKCGLHASGITQHFHFKANFSGGHDDTLASMTATVDGLPLACDKGSKTRLMGEDGDVSLECKFSINEKAGTELVLSVAVSWRHAQYQNFELASD